VAIIAMIYLAWRAACGLWWLVGVVWSAL